MTQRQLTVQSVFVSYGTGQSALSYRNFKHAMNDLHILGYQEIANLTKYMDADNDGFVKISDFETKI